MSLYKDIFYNTKITNESSYLLFIKEIKTNITNNEKIIYEKIPKPLIDNKKIKFSTDRDRFITEYNDKILLFIMNSDKQNNETIMIWYSEFGTTRHISLYEGKAILLDPDRAFLQSLEIQPNNTLYNSIVCDFKYYNIRDFIKRHNKDSYNLKFNYGII